MKRASPHKMKGNRHTGTPSTVSKQPVELLSSQNDNQILSVTKAQKPRNEGFPGFSYAQIADLVCLFLIGFKLFAYSSTEAVKVSAV